MPAASCCNAIYPFADALLETALRHSKVANSLTIGHPAGVSSPAPGPLHKGRRSMTSKFLLAVASAVFLLGAASTAIAADAKAPKPTAAVLKNLQAAQTAN